MKKLFIISLLVLILSACGNNANEENTDSTNEEGNQDLQEISVVLDWTPNTNHTGLYVARDNGYFEEEGLDVEIILPGEAGAEQLVATENADFGVSYQEGVTEARIQDIPIVSIAAVIQHNTSGFASHKEDNITTAKDFEGKSYGGWGAPLEKAVLESIMLEDNADVDQVEIVNIGNTDFFTALEQGIDFAWIYYGWDGIKAELMDQPINMVYLTDYSENLDYYTPVLITNEDKLEGDPEIVRSFLRAVTKGYEFAIDNPSEAADVLIKAVPDLEEELVKKSQEWLADKYQDDAEQWGIQKLEIWENYANWMYENDLLETELDSENAFTNEFLPGLEEK